MNVVIDYETALARHPNEVAAVRAMLARSRSKDRDCDPTHYVWTYFWGISGQSFSMGDLLAGNLPTETRSLEARIGSVTLCAHKGRKYGYTRYAYDYARDGAAGLPPEVRAYHERGYNEAERDVAAGTHPPIGPKDFHWAQEV